MQLSSQLSLTVTASRSQLSRAVLQSHKNIHLKQGHCAPRTVWNILLSRYPGSCCCASSPYSFVLAASISLCSSPVETPSRRAAQVSVQSKSSLPNYPGKAHILWRALQTLVLRYSAHPQVCVLPLHTEWWIRLVQMQVFLGFWMQSIDWINDY